MCFDPVSLSIAAAAAAATAGGNRLNQLSSNRAIKQQVGLENARQKIYQDQADANFGNALSNFKAPNNQQQVADVTASRTKSITDNLASPDTGSYEAFQNNQPDIVKSGIAKSLSDAVSKSKGQAQRLAALGATGDVMANNNISLDRAGSNAGMIGNFAQGSSAVSKEEQAAAAQKTTPWGDALKLGGQAGSIYALAGAPGASSLFGGTTYAAPASSMFPWSSTGSLTMPTKAADISGLGGLY